MASFTIVSGSPGSGKTTLASRLAKASPLGVHIPSDLFYSFPAKAIDPTLPESHSQNRAIMHALGATSSAFLSSGYDVVLDGIVGPWFLAEILEPIPPGQNTAYVILGIEEAEALRRVRGREGRGMSGRVLATREAFRRSTGFAEHEFDTTGLDPEEVFRRVSAAISAGTFDLRRS